MTDHAAPPKPPPVDYDELFPGRFIKAGLLKGREVTLTISSVAVEKLPQDDGTVRDRGIIAFRERPDKQLVLNSTNGQCIKAMFGRVLASWLGKRITLAPERDRFGREMVDCIRIAGSPDLPADIQIEVVLPRKKPKPRTLRRTGKARASQPRASTAAVDAAVAALPDSEPYEPGCDG
uniref:Uncharacterized protein n=1 Tax=viral metagenome TaxID=1070528 RepID=A0A6M3J6U6_9ZZZZ